MGWIKLVQGDEENLEGRVIVYSIAKSLQKSGGHLIIGCSSSSKPIDDLKVIIESCETEEELLNSQIENVDIIFVGKYIHPLACRAAIQAGMEFYSLSFIEQSIQKRFGSSSKGQKKQPTTKTYRDINSQNIERYIKNHYIKPLLDAKSKCKEKNIRTLRDDFIRFSIGSPFENYVSELCRIIEEGKPEELIKISENYANRIVLEYKLQKAVEREDYETATKLRDQLERLNPKE